MQPEIRFNGFSDDWVEKKLDQSKIRIATGKLNANAATINGKYPFFTTALETYMTDSYSFDDDAILIAGNGNLGFIKEYSGKFDAYQREYVLTNFEGYDKSYLVSYFKHLLGEHISHSSKGSAMPYITKDVLESFLIAASTLPEQQKIGALFSKYDNIIALREQKLEELNALKKGLLQQMFGDGIGDLYTPQIRFNGFSDEWVEKKFGNVVHRRTKMDDNFGLPHLQFEDVKSNYGLTKSFNELIHDSRKGVRFYKDDVLFGKLRPYLNKWVYSSFDGIALGDFWVFYSHDVLSGFLYNFVQTSRYMSIASMTSGTKMPRSNWNLVSNVNILVPSLPEQQKIGQLFKNLDTRILNEQSKIEQLKAQKQGLLQRML